MARTIKEALSTGKKGFYIGHRIVLPFKCQILKLIIDGEIHTEMVGGKNVKLHEDPHNTSIYIRSIGRLSNLVGSYKHIKMVCCEVDEDICDFDSHTKLIFDFEDGHKINFHVPDQDDLFIE